MVKILVFDTETTDKPPIMPGSSWAERQTYEKSLLAEPSLETQWPEMISKWPSIIQLSYILYDTDSPESAKIFNKYIDIPDNIVISEGSLAVHHITREKIASAPPENRATIPDALNEFLEDVKTSDIVVGHNVQFDRKMVVAELLRLSSEDNLPQISDMMNDDNFECTMEQTTPICKLKIKQKYTDKKTGAEKSFYTIKSPKLSESYEHFFGYQPSGEALHDALVDVVVCLRVFLKYNSYQDVCGNNSIITGYIMAISPDGYTCPSGKPPSAAMAGGSKRRKTKSKRRKTKSKRRKTKSKH